MCLYPTLIKNRKYTENKKNGGLVPAVSDPRTLYVATGCGQCIECRKQKAREWQVRLTEDIKTNTNGKFVTLTFSNESIKLLCKHEKLANLKGYTLDNALATLATRLFLERWRKKYGKSLRHWLVTELGHQGTENIHLHGIVWPTAPLSEVRDIWSYGYVYPDKYTEKLNYVNAQTVNYCVKYVNKIDEDHKYFKSKILTTPGIGSNYLQRKDSKRNAYDGTNTNETYRTPSGHKMALPIYYRNKIYTEKEKESLWLQKLDKNERFVCGEKVKANDTEQYFKILEYHRQRNKQLGYHDNSKNWEREEYERQRRIIMMNRRMDLTDEGYPASWDE